MSLMNAASEPLLKEDKEVVCILNVAPKPIREQKAIETAEDKHVAKKILKEILISTSSFGMRSLFVGAHHVGNGLIMSSLGATTAAASSVTTTIQTFTVGASAGFLVGTGVDLGVALGKGNIQAAGEVARTGWVVSWIFGGLSSAAFLSTRYTLPLVLERSTADTAADFFETFAIGAIPDLLVWTNGQIIFKVEKNSIIPLLSTVLYRGSALGLSYYFAIPLGYGARGVGLGAALGAWGSVLIFQPWFSRATYKKLNLYNLRIENFRHHLKKMMSDGWKFSLQRITEWVNLTIITQIVGAWSNQGLLASQPSILMLTLCNLLSQGFAQASMMISIEDCTKIKRLFGEFEATGEQKPLVQARKLLNKNYKNLYLTTASGLIFNTVLAGSLYLVRNTIIDWYVPDEAHDSTVSLAETLLWLNAISLIPDAIRIITGGVLRGWGDLLTPTLLNLLIMTVIGIPAGLGIGLELSESILAMFVARLISLALSAIVNSCRISTHMKKDEIEYDNLLFASDLLLSFNAHDVAKDLVDNAKIITLKQQVSEFGFTVRDSEETINNLFSIVAIAIGQPHTPASIKIHTVRHIRSNPHVYVNFFAGHDRETFFKDLSSGNETLAQPLCALAIARACNISLIIINSDHAEPNIIYQQSAINIVCIGHDNGKYYLLDGEPNAEMARRIDVARAAGWHREHKKHPITKSIPSYFFTKNKANGSHLRESKQIYTEPECNGTRLRSNSNIIQ